MGEYKKKKKKLSIENFTKLKAKELKAMSTHLPDFI